MLPLPSSIIISIVITIAVISFKFFVAIASWSLLLVAIASWSLSPCLGRCHHVLVIGTFIICCPWCYLHHQHCLHCSCCLHFHCCCFHCCWHCCCNYRHHCHHWQRWLLSLALVFFIFVVVLPLLLLLLLILLLILLLLLVVVVVLLLLVAVCGCHCRCLGIGSVSVVCSSSAALPQLFHSYGWLLVGGRKLQINYGRPSIIAVGPIANIRVYFSFCHLSLFSLYLPLSPANRINFRTGRSATINFLVLL